MDISIWPNQMHKSAMIGLKSGHYLRRTEKLLSAGGVIASITSYPDAPNSENLYYHDTPTASLLFFIEKAIFFLEHAVERRSEFYWPNCVINANPSTPYLDRQAPRKQMLFYIGDDEKFDLFNHCSILRHAKVIFSYPHYHPIPEFHGGHHLPYFSFLHSFLL